ncbi:MAG: HEAT repeat domain-containing protein [Candidatus Helarchaeota archaeon]
MVRTAAANAISGIGKGSTKAIPTLLTTLEDNDWRVRYRAINTLVQICEDAVPSLLEVINHKNPLVRKGVIETLGEIQLANPKVIEGIANSLKDRNEGVRGKAADALRSIGKESIPALIDSFTQVGKETKLLIIAAIGHMGRDAQNAIPDLIRILQSRNARIRAEAARSLGKLDVATDEVVNALKVTMVDRRSIVRRETAIALGKLGIGASDGIPELLDALKDKKSDVRWRAIEALGRIGINKKEIIQALNHLLYDKFDYVAAAAQEALDLISED